MVLMDWLSDSPSVDVFILKIFMLSHNDVKYLKSVSLEANNIGLPLITVEI